jgi:hypothetical protein
MLAFIKVGHLRTGRHGGPEAERAFVGNQMQTWGKVVKDNNIKADQNVRIKCRLAVFLIETRAENPPCNLRDARSCAKFPAAPF